MSAYYSENDPFAAAWLRGLIGAGLIAPGHVDERDIRDIRAGDLAGYEQCHFFAGIGGWSVALRLAGWPDDRPVWTGSCPCQPYSSAGKGEGADDARNLWPAWFRLIRECRPSVVFGEQVEAAVRHGWLDAVSTDVEAEGYSIGACVLGAHSVGAPHIRQRVYFVADGGGEGLEGRERVGRVQRAEVGSPSREASERGGDAGALADADSAGQRPGGGGVRDERDHAGWSGEACVWLPCRDGKARPTKPGLFPLAHGVPNRVGTLRGAGNAICPQAAAEFIGAFCEVMA